VNHKFVGEVYYTPLTIFEKLDQIRIHVAEEDRYFPFRATFDLESYFFKRNLPEGRLVQWNAEHIPLSVSVANIVQGFIEPVCFINNNRVDEIIKEMLEYLEEISRASYKILSKKFQHIFSLLESKPENE